MNLSMAFEKFRYFIFERKKVFLKIYVIRIIFFWVMIIFYFYYLKLLNNHYMALKSLLRFRRDIEPFSQKNKIPSLYYNIFRKFVVQFIVNKKSLLTSFILSEEAKSYRKIFSDYGYSFLVRMKYPRRNDDPRRQGDLLVLKPKINNVEKGVLFIQYNEGIKKFVSIYDVEMISSSYRIVVEPSTCDYQNPMFFLLYGLNTEIVFQSQFKPDFQYIRNLGMNFIPIRVGAGDWIDPRLFYPDENIEKQYDCVMIANWLPWKRHLLLFKAISEIESQINKVALIGYPTEGATIENIKKISRKFGIENKIDIYESIPYCEVSRILKKSKIGILLSKEEGANRGIYECFFSNIPVIMTKENRGVNRDHINKETGMLSSDKELAQVMIYMLENLNQFNPRNWAIKNTGYEKSTQRLNHLLKDLAIKNEENWTKDIYFKKNVPHARYVLDNQELEANDEFMNLKHFLR